MMNPFLLSHPKIGSLKAITGAKPIEGDIVRTL
jgi:hypothetical protein